MNRTGPHDMTAQPVPPTHRPVSEPFLAYVFVEGETRGGERGEGKGKEERKGGEREKVSRRDERGGRE